MNQQMNYQADNPLTNELLKVKIKETAKRSNRGMVRVSMKMFEELVQKRIINAMGRMIYDLNISVIPDRNIMGQSMVPIKIEMN